jgi:hypothetical protein
MKWRDGDSLSSDHAHTTNPLCSLHTDIINDYKKNSKKTPYLEEKIKEINPKIKTDFVFFRILVFVNLFFYVFAISFLYLLCLVGIIFFCLRRHSGTGRIIYNSIIKKDKECERERERKRDMGKRKIQHFHIGSLMKSRNIYTYVW